ncbi:VWA domain-containing protein [Albimonas sp. CAU 1670]|uniref:VWA domain-containing protein n=1 Tax=Albimonas sp. CAU 1670 TaxID=3032599 RepID=UPI0023DB79C1|nr:VWA domain-containing protein [Albimonas sp. CAU 1670]MDF2231734.1 VWA domain-containing protein [Albimonas sp. CAU 1670]
MAFASIKNKTTFTGFSAADKTKILDAMKTGYDGSATAKKMFDDWIAAGKDIDVVFAAGKFQARVNAGKIEIDLAYLDKANYIDNNGKAVIDTPVTAILHEFVHALTGKRDNWDGVTEYRGDTVKMSNKMYKELGIPEQNSYIAYDSSGNILTRDREYTAGAEIDRSESGNRDWNSSAAGVSKDLLIGGAGANNLQSGRGADVLFGAGGDDQLNGGDGDDVALLTGKPTDYDVRVNPDGTWTSRHVRGDANEGTDTFSNIEKVRFTGDETFSLSKGGLTFQTDFAFVVDTTGSMSDDIGAVQAAATGVIDALFNDDSIDARVGVVSYKDNDNGEPTQVLLQFTDDDDFAARKAAAQAAINSLSASGGGDFPESAFDGLLKALDGSMGDWRAGAGTKRIALFTDATANDAHLLPAVLSFALNIGAVISSRSTTELSSFATVDTFEFSFGDGLAGRDPGSEGDKFPAFVPTDDPVAPLSGTASVQITTIQIGDPSSVDADLLDAVDQTGGAVVGAADPAAVVEQLLTLINTPNYSIAADLSTVEEGDEGSTRVTFTISRDRADNAAVVTLGTTGDAGPEDVTGVNGSVALDVGETSVSFKVRVIGDLENEGDETFGMTIDSIDETATVGIAEAGFTILDDDATQIGTGDDDVLLGTNRQDRLEGRGGDDLMRGFKAADVLLGGGGDDRGFAGKGGDVLRGNRGDDLLQGRQGGDKVHGGFGKDVVRGGAGDDVIDGGRGIDKLVGGSEADVFVLVAGVRAFDRVKDFEDGIDSFRVLGADGLGADDLVFRAGDGRARVFLGDDLLAVVQGDFAALDPTDFAFA